MLPSVSADSAILKSYAPSPAPSAPTAAATAHDSETAPERETGRRRDAGAPPASATATPEDADLENDSRAAVQAILDLLGTRVLAALLDIGLPAPLAADAAAKAVAALARTVADDGQHAAQIVHAILERLHAGKPVDAEALLHLAARGLTINIDHADGAVRIDGPALSLRPGHAERASPAPLHLLDITDAHSDDAAPVFRILGAVRDAALAAAGRPDAPVAAPTQAARLVVAPDAFVDAIAHRIAPVLAAPTFAAPAAAGPQAASGSPAARDFARVVSRVVAQAVNGGQRLLTAAEAVAAIEGLSPLPAPSTAASPANAASPAAGTTAGDGRQVFGAGKITVAIEPQHGSVTVRIGDRTTVYAPASLAPPLAGRTPLTGLSSLPLPVVGLPGTSPSAVAGRPVAVPFVPPAIAALAAADAARPAAAATPSAETAARAAADMDAATVRLIETAVARNATVLRALLTAPAGDEARTTRITLDLGASVVPVAPGMQPQTPPVGRFGLPSAAPVPGEAGPVRAEGHLDATATLPPVLPAWHAVGTLPAPPKRPRNRPALPSLRRQAPHALVEDAFDRQMPSGFEGLVFTVVTVSA